MYNDEFTLKHIFRQSTLVALKQQWSLALSVPSFPILGLVELLGLLISEFVRKHCQRLS